jgi:hypothetical protein
VSGKRSRGSAAWADAFGCLAVLAFVAFVLLLCAGVIHR